METVLVLGGTGTVGTRLLDAIRQLKLDQRLKVVCTFRSEVSARKIESYGLESVFVDLDEPQSLMTKVAGVTTIFLLKPYGLKMLNYAKSVVDAASSAGVRAIVNLSAFGPDCSSIDLLVWHRLVDSYVECSGLSFTHLRPSFFMEGLAARINFEERLVYGFSGNSNVPWVAAADIARTAVSIIGDVSPHAGKAYSLVSETVSVPQVATLLSELTGKPFKAVAMDEETAIKGLVARGREPIFARAIVEYGKLVPMFTANNEEGTIRSITGDAATSLRKFFENYLLNKSSTTNA